jgi:hypothetical protein
MSYSFDRNVILVNKKQTSSSGRILSEQGLAGSTEFAWRGKLFFTSSLETVASAGIHYFSFTSPSDKYTAIYARNIEASEFEWNVDTIIGATYTPGTVLTTNNSRLGFSNTADSVFTTGVTNVSGGVVGQQTMISGGKNIAGGASGQGTGVIIYPPDFDALVRVENLGNSSARVQLFVVFAEFTEDELP